MPKTEKTAEELQKEFGSWLKTQRKMANVTQQMVADGVPMDRVHYARIENGGSGTKRDTVLAIVEVINKKSQSGHRLNQNEALDRFFGRWQAASQHTEEDDDALVAGGLFEGYYELSEEKRKIARRVIASTIRSLQEEDD